MGPNFMSGTIPSTISSLSNLTYLSFRGCNVSGTLPDLSGLSNLRYLWATTTLLSGTIPSYLGTLPSLMCVMLSLRHLWRA